MYMEMVYNRNNKTQKNKKDQLFSKKNNTKYKKRGGGCGCMNNNSKITGGSAYLAELSTQSYYPYYDVTKDPNNIQISTSIPSNNITSMSGGSGSGSASASASASKRKLNKKTNKKRKNVKKQKGGLSGPDFVSSLGNSNLVNNMSNYLIGSPVSSNPSYLQNVMSVNQHNSNIPSIPPGLKYYV